MTTQSFDANTSKEDLGAPLIEGAGTMTILMKTNRYYTDGSLLKAKTSYSVSRDWGKIAVERCWASDTNSVLPMTPLVVGFNADGTILDSDGGVLVLSEVITEALCTASATTTVLTGAGVFPGYRCTTAAGNITIYDNTAASGKVLVPTTALTVGSFPIMGAGTNGKLAVTLGITVVLSGAAVVYAGIA